MINDVAKWNFLYVFYFKANFIITLHIICVEFECLKLTVLSYGDGFHKYYCILVTKSNKIVILSSYN